MKNKIIVALLLLVMVLIAPASAFAISTRDFTISDNVNKYSYAENDGIVWISSKIGYMVTWTGSSNSVPCTSGNSPCRLMLYKTINSGISWDSGTVIESVDYNTNSPIITGASLWYDKWTPDDNGSYIHIAWNSRAFQTVTTKYRRYDVLTDAFDIAVQSVGSTCSTASGGTTTTALIGITKSKSGTLYIHSYRVCTPIFFSSVNGTTWTARSTSGTAIGIISYGNETDEDVIYHYAKSSTTVTIRTYTLATDTWASVYTDTENQWSGNDRGYPVSVTACNGNFYLLTFGNEGTPNGNGHLQLRILRKPTIIYFVSDLFNTETKNRYYMSPARIFCNENTDRMYVVYSYKVGATSAISNPAEDEATKVFMKQFTVQSAVFSSEIQINNPEQSSPNYIVNADSAQTAYAVQLGWKTPIGYDGRFMPYWISRYTCSGQLCYYAVINSIANIENLGTETLDDTSHWLIRIRNMTGWTSETGNLFFVLMVMILGVMFPIGLKAPWPITVIVAGLLLGMFVEVKLVESWVIFAVMAVGIELVLAIIIAIVQTDFVVVGGISFYILLLSYLGDAFGVTSTAINQLSITQLYAGGNVILKFIASIFFAAGTTGKALFDLLSFNTDLPFILNAFIILPLGYLVGFIILKLIRGSG